MGNNQSSTINNVVEVFNSSLNSVLIERTQTTESINIQENQFVFNNRGTINCGINITQNNQSLLRTAALLESKVKADLSSIIENTIDQVAKNSSTNTSEFLQLTFNNQDSESNNIVRLKNDIKNIFKDSVAQKCLNFNRQNNELIFNNEGTINCPPGANTLIFDQRNFCESISECITSTITDVLMKTYTGNTIEQKAENTLDLTVKGIVDIVNSFFGMFEKIAIVIGVVIVIVLALVIFFLLKGSGGAKKKMGELTSLATDLKTDMSIGSSLDNIGSLDIEKIRKI